MYQQIVSDEYKGGHPNPLCILFSDTKVIQSADTDASYQDEYIRYQKQHH